MEDGFTPLYDSAIRELGRTNGQVYCVVKRFCAMRDGYCHASLATMADKLGVGRSTIFRALQELEAGGYLSKVSEATPRVPAGYVCKVDFA